MVLAGRIKWYNECVKEKVVNTIFILVLLFIVILLFTIIDHFIHGLEGSWSVPDYYFRNKIPFGLLWGVVGLLLAMRINKVWLKSLVVAGIISVTLQTRYFLEGYPLDFVLLFLLFHFIILYFLLLIMFFVYNKYTKINIL